MKEQKDLRSQLRTWLKEICPKQNVEDYCQIMANSTTPELMKVRVFTHDYRYSIYATGRPDEPEKFEKALLSCDATRRKSLAGRTEHTFTHLVYGQFTRVTWELIKAAILRFELVKITVKTKLVGEKEEDITKSKTEHLYEEFEKEGRRRDK